MDRTLPPQYPGVTAARLCDRAAVRYSARSGQALSSVFCVMFFTSSLSFKNRHSAASSDPADRRSAPTAAERREALVAAKSLCVRSSLCLPVPAPG